MVGTAESFPIAVYAGYPMRPAVTLSDAPEWLTVTGSPGGQRLSATPPVGAGGVYTFTLTLTGSSVTQQFTLTVNESPVIGDQPASLSVLEGTDAVFTTTATGYPAPTVKWQRSDDTGWTDIPGATTTTLTIPATMNDDDTRLRAVFTSTSGTATTDEVSLRVGQVPALDEIDPVTTLAGGAVSIDVTSSGLPFGVITATGVPAWLTVTDNGDGTAVLTGTPALTDATPSTVALTV